MFWGRPVEVSWLVFVGAWVRCRSRIKGPQWRLIVYSRFPSARGEPTETTLLPLFVFNSGVRGKWRGRKLWHVELEGERRDRQVVMRYPSPVWCGVDETAKPTDRHSALMYQALAFLPRCRADYMLGVVKDKVRKDEDESGHNCPGDSWKPPQ
ncbi:hypothetical protein QBC39DRAFT_153699 [Podospora conica]|nr:hypothetical protein QBC39DRAFT_153699 [Schizothecium conicum]